jgi:hypothetical protein
MKNVARSFPHPVLSPFADDVNAELQVNGRFRKTKDGIEFRFVGNLSSNGLLNLMRQQIAQFGVYYSCVETRKRGLLTDRNHQGESSFELVASLADAEVSGNVDLIPFIYADRDIPSYNLPGEFHEDYEGRSFSVRKGDILAVSRSLYANVSALPSISSVIVVTKQITQSNSPVHVDTNNRNIIIRLPNVSFEYYRRLRASYLTRDAANNGVILPAIIAILAMYKAIEEGLESSEEVADAVWFDAIRNRLSVLGYDNLSTVKWSGLFELATKLIDLGPERFLKSLDSVFSVRSFDGDSGDNDFSTDG